VQAHPNAHPDDSAAIREQLAAQTARADGAERARDQAEADRDAWREQARQLANKSPFWRLFGK
jgi:phage shock protein A